MEFDELLKSRYSCRKFNDKEVEQEKIDEIIKAASIAPTAVNMQPFKIFNVKSNEAKLALNESCKYTFGANNFLIVGYKNELGWTRKFDSRPFADVDASIVATYIMLKIKDLGLDTTWVGYFDEPKLKSLCPALNDYELIAIFPIGYAADDAEPSPRHYERKHINEITQTI